MHELRCCCKWLEHLFRDGGLFAYAEPELLKGESMPATRNRLEGGIDPSIKRMLDDHRGTPLKHLEPACEWKCYMRSERPDPKVPSTHTSKDSRRKLKSVGA